MVPVKSFSRRRKKGKREEGEKKEREKKEEKRREKLVLTLILSQKYNGMYNLLNEKFSSFFSLNNQN